LNLGYTDSFRHLVKEPHHYSWWSYRANARTNNKSWHIDYHIITDNLVSRLKSARILPDAKHSEHCPVVMELED
jgi:exodeoxyribonuclease-3